MATTSPGPLVRSVDTDGAELGEVANVYFDNETDRAGARSDQSGIFGGRRRNNL